jgi:hypothetical protein
VLHAAGVLDVEEDRAPDGGERTLGLRRALGRPGGEGNLGLGQRDVG